MVDHSHDVARSLYAPKDIIIPVAGVPQLVPLNENNFTFETKNAHKESVNCLQLLEPDAIKKCHDLGIQKQERDNVGIRERAALKGITPVTRTYVGYVQAQVRNIIGWNISGISFTVEQHTENGNEAHCNITMVFDAKADLKMRITAIRRIAKCFETSTNYP